MIDLFGNDVTDIKDRPNGERIAVHLYKQLISIYGKVQGKKCKDCIHCERWEKGSKKVFKCALAKNTNSQATDWNSRWDACGQFKK